MATTRSSASRDRVVNSLTRDEITAIIQSTIDSQPPPPIVQSAGKDHSVKGPKPDKYKGGSRGAYNVFIRQMEKLFANENVLTDQAKINSAVCYLEGTPDEVWEAYTKHHIAPDSLTWENFKEKILSELGDIDNLQRSLLEDFYDAKQGPKETVYQFSARLDKLREDLGETATDLQRANKLRHGLKYFIKNIINEQATQATTHAELLAQAQRIEDTDAAKQKAREAYAKNLPKQNRNDPNNNNNHSGRGRGGFRGRGRGRGGQHHQGDRNSTNQDSSTQNNNEKGGNTNRLSKEEHKRRKDNDLCFKCSKPGHKAKDCPDNSKNQDAE